MIQYVDGNIFDSRAQCLVNPVNCVGVMGKGLALQFKHKFPEMFTYYKKICKQNNLYIGTVAFYKHKKMSHIVCLFPTKLDWRHPSTLDYIDTSLIAFSERIAEYHISRVAFPKVGCGEGGLDFEYHVRPLLERRLGSLDIDIEVYI
jgi:O-acetyl-ADP-ribose deacetylase (regulator of RNase III)